MKFLFLVAVVAAVLLELNWAHEHSADECWCQLESHLAEVTPSADIKQLIENLKSLNAVIGHLPLYEMLQDERLESDVRRAGFIDDAQEEALIDSCYTFVESALTKMQETDCGTKQIAGAFSTSEVLEVLEHHPKLEEVFNGMEACRSFIIN